MTYNANTVDDGKESDYGSEFGTDDEATLSILLTQADPQLPTPAEEHLTPSISLFARGVRRKYIDEDGVVFEMLSRDGPVGEASVEIEYDQRNRASFSPRPDPSRQASQSHLEHIPQVEQPDAKDERSPIERFRTPPKKPLSVTDIISPAWCEMQYWYSLTKYGRVRRTAAMKQGSSVHKVLEEQVSTVLPVDNVKPLVEKVFKEELKTDVPIELLRQVVENVLIQEKRTAVPLDMVGGLVHQVLEKGRLAPIDVGLVSESIHRAIGAQVQKAVSVDVVTKEDAFGLRIWNTIQSLRTLRTTGMTRELEVWALIDGQIVNGVIDELSYDCPDTDFEAEINQKKDEEQQKPRGRGRGRPKKQKVLPQSQSTMDVFLGGSPHVQSDNDAQIGIPQANRKIYITDVKTRGSRSMPKGEASFRPTSMQLMMYHRMLSLLASNSVPAEAVFDRYSLDSTATFSDTFIAQMGSLEFNFPTESVENAGVLFESGQDAIDELLAHNTLEKIWILMMSEFQRTIKSTPVLPIGDVLRAEFRASGSGSVIGSKVFAYDQAILDRYLESTMAWWKGDRMPKGVDIEEAFKCRICEFAEVCTWRKDKVDEGIRKVRLRNQRKKKSDV